MNPQSKRFSTLLFSAVLFVSLSNLPVAEGRDRRNIRVLYLGNDYYQDPDGNWIDANTFIIDALENSRLIDFVVTHIPPALNDEWYLSFSLEFYEYDVVIFSEVWSTHFKSEQLSSLQDFVGDGGGFIMFGGWGGFGGYQEYGEWDGTVVEEILPVEISSNEDAVDMDFWLKPNLRLGHSPQLRKVLKKRSPVLHGYNDVEAKKNAKVLAVNSENDALILVVGNYKSGRTVAFASNPAGGRA